MGMRRRNAQKRALLKQEQEKEHRRIEEVRMKEQRRGKKSYYIVADQDIYIYNLKTIQSYQRLETPLKYRIVSL